MRKIVTTAVGDKHRALAPVVLTIACLWTVGCGGGAENGSQQERASQTASETSCVVRVHADAVRAFYDVVDRVEAGETVSVEEMSELFTNGAYDGWRQTLVPEPNKPLWLGLMMFIGVAGEDALPDDLRGKSRQPNLIAGFRESAALRRYIEPRVAELQDGELLCQAVDLLAAWAPADSLPAELPIELICARPEIRYFDGTVYLDAGLAWAAGDQQLPGFLASLVYKEIAHFPGLAPKDASGPGILMESWRTVHNLVVPAHLERTDRIVFDRRHPMLDGHGPDPEAIGSQATRTLVSLDAALTRLRGLETVNDQQWLNVYRLFVGAQSWQATAWFVGQVIEQALGTELLQQAARHPADMLAAYQEAALATAPDPSLTEGTLAWMLKHPPAFTGENARWFEDQLSGYFH